MHALIDHLRDLAANHAGSGDESPLDPGIARRSSALLELAVLLEDDPSLVRPGVQQTIESQVFEPLPGDPTPVLGARAGGVVARHGWDGPVTVPDHLRALDRLAGALIHDAWELAEVGGTLLIDETNSADDMGVTLGLHGFEVEAAVAGSVPDPAYFLRRPGLTEEERRAELAAAMRSG